METQIKIKNNLNFSRPWAMEQSEFQKLTEMTALAIRAPRAMKALYEAEAIISDRNYRIQGDVAIIPVSGQIFRYDDICTALFGATSIEAITKMYEDALTDEAVSAIIFDVNSPGGSADGPFELAEMIFNNRNLKPTVGYVSSMAASAGYLIVSACEYIVAQNASMLGSIGVVSTFRKHNSDDVVFVSSVSPKKRIDIETDEGKKQIQDHVNKFGEIFVGDVAKYRGIEPQGVEADFGEGGVKFSTEAVASGMADKVGTFQDAFRATQKMMEDKIVKSEFKNNQILIMDGEKEVMSISKIDIMKGLPEFTGSLISEGMSTERKRQVAINGISISGEKQIALQKDAVNGRLTVDQYTAKIEEQKKLDKIEVDRQADADEIPGTTGGGNSQDTMDSLMKDAVKGVFGEEL